jgi:hypothetical protein
MHAGERVAQAIDARRVQPESVIDLTNGAGPVKAGFGRVTIRFEIPRAPRRIQVGTPTKAIVIVTKPDGTEISDENANNAVYPLVVNAGVATVALPGLPVTTPTPPSSMTSNAHVLTVLFGNWSGAAPSTYAGLTSGQFQFGSRANGKYTFTSQLLGRDLRATNLTPNQSDALLSSGWTRFDVVSGYSPTVSNIRVMPHFPMHFQNSASYLAPENPGPASYSALISIGRQNSTVQTGIFSDSGGIIRLRHPALNPDEVDVSTQTLTSVDGTTGANRRILRMVVQLETTTFTSAPRLSVWKYDPVGGASSSINPDVSNRQMTLVAQTINNSGYTLANKLALADIDVTGPVIPNFNMVLQDLDAAEFNVVDFALSGLPASTEMRVWLIPLGTHVVTSGGFSPDMFQ